MSDDRREKNSEPLAWTVTQWRAKVGISSAFCWRLIRDDRVRSVKLGKRRLITTPPAEFLANLPRRA